jgi:hypothetical protein
MKTSDLQRILSDIHKLNDELCETDHDWERSATPKRSVMASTRPYHKILIERKKKSQQSTLHAFFKKWRYSTRDFIRELTLLHYAIAGCKCTKYIFLIPYTWCNPKVPEIWMPRENRL